MKTNRIQSLDLLKGLVMIIMALDHVRDYFHYDAFFFDPTDIGQTNLAIFFTRFVTHFCAPVFIFLAGTSAFIVRKRKSKKELSIWLLKRGIWLILAEITIIKFGWLFQLDLQKLTFQVIWVLGASMIFLAGLIHLPRTLVIAASLIIIFTHNFFDGISPEGPVTSVLWSFLHEFNFNQIGPVMVVLAYPLIPWVFVMALGYHFGALYEPEYPSKKRRQLLLWSGWSMIIGFVIIRYFNLFGDSNPFLIYETLSKTIISFFNVSKYPPSTLYLLITLGPAMLFLTYTENLPNQLYGWKSKLTEIVTIFGRVPMFYYIVHIYIIHIGALFLAVATGFQASDMVIDAWVNFEPGLRGYGVTLPWMYLIWLVVLAALFPLCKWYDQYKKNNREKWWLSYL